MGLGGGSRGTTHPRSSEGRWSPNQGSCGFERMSVMALKEQVFGSYATICPTTLVEYESYAYKIIYYHTLYEVL